MEVDGAFASAAPKEGVILIAKEDLRHAGADLHVPKAVGNLTSLKTSEGMQ
jgi:hypothetical protein